jgi:hypothetical protein
MMVIVEKLVELRLAGETEVLGENLPQRHFVHHKSHMTRPGSTTTYFLCRYFPELLIQTSEAIVIVLIYHPYKPLDPVTLDSHSTQQLFLIYNKMKSESSACYI